MDHRDHVALLRDGIPTATSDAPAVWADVGSGEGAFTLALADVLGPGATIHSVDRDRGALSKQARVMRERYPDTRLVEHVADFTRPLELPPLDGIVMANSLHFVKEKAPVVERLVAHLRPGGSFILVEYDADRGNMWVPYPLSFDSWRALAERVGLRATRRLHSVPSRFLGAIYSAGSQAAAG